MTSTTPSNIAARLLKPGRVEGVAGVNLPMLIKALSYREQPLAIALAKAMAGGADGICLIPSMSPKDA